MARVLAPGGTLLIANLTSFCTAGGWTEDPDGVRRFRIDDYLEERAEWAAWHGIRVHNWHRPLSLYMSLLLGQGLALRHFDEPAPQGGDPAKVARYRQVPWFVVMEWRRRATDDCRHDARGGVFMRLPPHRGSRARRRREPGIHDL